MMLQEFINTNFYRLLMFTLIFGVMFYDTIGFDYTDELCSLFLFILFLKNYSLFFKHIFFIN